MEHEPQRSMEERPYLSIGDVLDILRGEFPEITISKIRFLESQGLIDPERTPSGYRKFFEEDVERLKWVLRQQREHYLPLKVIKGKLEGRIPRGTGDARNAVDEQPVQPIQVLHEEEEHQSTQASVPSAPSGSSRERANIDTPYTRENIGVGQAAVWSSSGGLSRAQGAEVQQIQGQGAEVQQARTQGTESWRVGVRQDRVERADSRVAESISEHDISEGDVSEPIPADEGASSSVLKELESYGLISGERIGGVITYGASDAEISSIASRIMEYGFEARHLKVFKHAVDREMSIIEQAVVPLLRLRNPKSLEKARNSAKELLQLSEKLHSALMRAELNRLFPPGD